MENQRRLPPPTYESEGKEASETRKDDRTKGERGKDERGRRIGGGLERREKTRDGIMFEAIIGRLRILAGPLWLIKGARSGLLCAADLLLAPSRRTPPHPPLSPSSLPPAETTVKYNFRQARKIVGGHRPKINDSLGQIDRPCSHSIFLPDAK